MRYEDCFRLLSERLRGELVVTAAGNSSEIWWDLTHETESVFYLEASMSLTSMFAAGIAMGVPGRNVIAWMFPKRDHLSIGLGIQAKVAGGFGAACFVCSGSGCGCHLHGQCRSAAGADRVAGDCVG